MQVKVGSAQISYSGTMSARVTPIFHADPQGRVLAVRNWRNRQHRDDAVVAVPLDTGETENYRAMQSRGLSDSAIFAQLFDAKQPVEKRKDEIVVPLSLLKKDQLVELIRQKSGAPLESLASLTLKDLRDLLRVLNR